MPLTFFISTFFKAYLPASMLFFLRLLWIYLFGMYSTLICMTSALWTCSKGVKQCDILSLLFYIHTHLGHADTRWSIRWTDNCPGQNRNHY